MRQLAATLKQPDGLQKAGVWWTVAQDLINRTDQRMGERYADLFTPLVAAIAEVRGDFEQVPDWIYPAELTRHIRGEKVQCWLVRDPLNGYIALQRMPATQNQSALGEPLTIDSGGIRIESSDKHQWFPAPQFSNSLYRLNEETTVKLTTSTETLTLATINRPRGSMAWGCNTSGVWVRSPELCGQSFEWSTWPIPIEPSLKTVLAENGQYQLVENSLTRQADPRDIDKGTITYDYEEKTASSVKFVLDQFGVRADLNLLTAT